MSWSKGKEKCASGWLVLQARADLADPLPLTMKIARSALRISLALRERAGVMRETVMAAATYIFRGGADAMAVSQRPRSGSLMSSSRLAGLEQRETGRPALPGFSLLVLNRQHRLWDEFDSAGC
jgi:hypothetical protein